MSWMCKLLHLNIIVINLHDLLILVLYRVPHATLQVIMSHLILNEVCLPTRVKISTDTLFLDECKGKKLKETADI